MKYVDYVFFIMGNASLIISFFDNTSALPYFGGFGVLMMLYVSLIQI